MSLQATEVCTSHSKDILSVLKLYERTFPYRLMTYQVSYCVFTAATAEAYVMRYSSGELATEAAKTLGAALRILHHETSHTPGISGSLDTLRRQLMMGKQVRKGRRPDNNAASGQEPQGSDSNVNDTSAAMDISQSCSARDQVSTSVTENSTAPPSQHRDMHFAQELGFGIGVIDTGAGFHPNSFPWASTDWLHSESYLEPGWLSQGSRWGDING